MKFRAVIICCLTAGALLALDGPELADPLLTTAETAAKVPPAPASDAVIVAGGEEDKEVKSLRLDHVSMRDAARLLTATTDKQVVVSPAAAAVTVDMQLRDVTCRKALDAICRAYNLIYVPSPDDRNIFFVQTAEEFKGNLQFNNPDEVRVVPILYPDARDIGDALSKLFINRVIWNAPEAESGDSSEQLSRSLSRMDLLGTRSTIDASVNSSSLSSSISRSSNTNRSGGLGSGSYNSSGNNRFSGSSRSSTRLPVSDKIPDSTLVDAKDLTSEQLSRMRAMMGAGEGMDRVQELAANPGVVFISVLPQTNDLLLRSADKKALEQICGLIAQLDKPAPQVLLEVKVLEVNLDGSKERGVSYLFNNGNASGGFAADIPADLPLGASTGGYSVVNLMADNFNLRLKALERDQKVSSLMTPNLMVCDNESSTIFIGEEVTVMEKAQSTTTYTTNNNGNTTPQISWEIEAPRRQIGTALTICPKIHADRTVTIRLMQEHSTLGNTRDIVFSGTTNDAAVVVDNNETRYFSTQDINMQRLVSTVVGQDKKYIVIGGLVRENVGKNTTKVPVLGNIPVVGAAFSNKTATRSRKEIIVVIRPFVMIAPGEGQGVSQAYLERISQHPSARGDIPSLGVTAAHEMLKNRQIDPYDPWLSQMFNRLDGEWDGDDRERFPPNTEKQLRRDRLEYAPGELENIARDAGITISDTWREMK